MPTDGLHSLCYQRGQGCSYAEDGRDEKQDKCHSSGIEGQMAKDRNRARFQCVKSAVSSRARKRKQTATNKKKKTARTTRDHIRTILDCESGTGSDGRKAREKQRRKWMGQLCYKRGESCSYKNEKVAEAEKKRIKEKKPAYSQCDDQTDANLQCIAALVRQSKPDAVRDTVSKIKRIAGCLSQKDKKELDKMISKKAKRKEKTVAEKSAKKLRRVPGIGS